MKYHSDQDHALISLVNEFETKSQEGSISFMAELDFQKLINYYEKELLFEKAIEVVDLALSQHHFSSDFRLRKAQLLLATRNSEKAMTALEEAALFAPCEVDIQILRAKILSSMGNHHEALRLLDSVKDGAVTEELAEIFLCESMVFECVKAYDQMFESVKQSLTLDPDSEEALERIWACTEMSKRYKDSVTFHRQLIDRNPYSYFAWYNLGHAYNCLGEYDEAIEAYEFSFIINEEFELGYRESGDLCLQLCRFEKALSYYLEALENFGPDSDLLCNIGECYMQLKQYGKAKDYFSKSTKLDPYNDEVFYYLGQCFAREDRWLSAINAYFKAIEIEDQREEYYSDLAYAFSKVGEFAKAHYYYLKATEIGPEQCEIWKDHIALLIQLGEISKALEVVDEAEANTVGTELMYCRAACLFASGQRNQGMEALRNALNEDLDLSELIFELHPPLRDDLQVHHMISYFLSEIL